MTIQEMIGKDRLEKGIFWSRAWSLVDGCTPVSPGCDHCWSASLAHRFRKTCGELTPQVTQTDLDGRFNGNIQCRNDRLDLPLKVKKPQVWAVWNDLLYESVSSHFIEKALTRMWKAEHHIFLIITKRPERLNIISRLGHWPYKNVWLFSTAENQEQADKRIPILLQLPAAVRGLICEPLLGPIDLSALGKNNPSLFPWNALMGELLQETANLGIKYCQKTIKLDWVITGGESGPHARPMHPDWVRKLRDDCVAAGTPFFLKSLGEFGPGSIISSTNKRTYRMFHSKLEWEHKGNTWINGGTCIDMDGKVMQKGSDFDTARYPVAVVHKIGKKAAGRILDGRTWDQLPEVSNG